MPKRKDITYGFRLGGEDWELVLHKPVGEKEKDLGGECIHGEHKIRINSDYKGSNLRDYLFHELTEAAALAIGVSYIRGYPDKAELFVMDHTEMSSLATMVRAAYDDLIHVLGVRAQDTQ